jgi:hypothetical protein
MEKLVYVIGYMGETLFDGRHKRIAHMMKILVQTSSVKALLHFWDPNYKCFTFRDVDVTPTIKEYAQILNFPNDPHKVYFKQRI